MGTHDKALAERARTQLGLITAAQLADVAVGRKDRQARCADGRLERIHPGVHQVGGTPGSWRTSLLAACLGGGTGTVASHRAAAVLHELDGFGSAPIEITTRRSRNFFPATVVVHRPIRFLPVDQTAVRLVPVTSVAKTLIDLGAVVRPRRVEQALDGALRDGMVSLAFLRWRLDAYAARGRPGVGVLRRLLSGYDQGPPPQSVLERQFLRAIAPLDVPAPERQLEIRDRGGLLVAVVDFAWPELRVIVEVDGHAFHATRQQRAHDSARQNALAALGWRVLRFTYEQVVNDPAGVAAQVVAILRPLLVAS